MKFLKNLLDSILFIDLKKLCFLFSPIAIFGQIGIGTDTPKATLEIVSDAAKFNKAIEITNIENKNIFNLYSNGNFEFFGAFMSNDKAGNAGEYFVSNGSNFPVWKSIVPKDTKQLYEVFNANTTANTTFQEANTWGKYVFDNTNLTSDPTIGVWNASTSEFTVNKKGIYYIYVGVKVEMKPNVNPSSTSKMRISLGTKSYQVNATSTWNSVSTNPLFYDNMNAELVQILNVNETIKIEIINPSYDWKRKDGSIHIKYASL